MKTDWTYDGCDEEDERNLASAWSRWQPPLEAKAAELANLPGELRLAVEKGDDEPLWRIDAAMHLPGHTLVATSEGTSADDALEAVCCELVRQLDEEEPAAGEFTIRRAGLDGLASLLEVNRREGRSEAFLSFLAPVAQSLRGYVKRELRLREDAGTALGEGLRTHDVLDEVLTRAWELFQGRNERLPVDLWLVQLADQAMDDLAAPVAAESIDESVDSPGGPHAGSARDEWIEEANEPETIELAELLPGEPWADSWDALDLDEKHEHLAMMLGGLPRERRQAFVLSVAHGYSEQEIADFQERDESQVADDVAQAKLHVRRYFDEERAPDEAEPFELSDLREQRRRRW